MISKFVKAINWNQRKYQYYFIFSLVAFLVLYLIVGGRPSRGSTNYNSIQDIFQEYQKPSSLLQKYGPISEYEYQIDRNPNWMNNQRGERVSSTHIDEFIPERTASKGENECRRVIQLLTGKSFVKVRPQWLLNPISGGFMELDMYCDSMKLAIEYNGQQHYSYSEFMHNKNKDKFALQKYKDYVKRDLCKKNNIYLIEVPYTIKFENIESYLQKEYQEYLKKRM